MFRLIFNLILVGAALALFFVYIKPNYTDSPTSVKALKAEKVAIQETILSLSQLEEKQTSLLARRNEFESRQDGSLARIERLVPTEINPVIFIMELNTIAADNGMSIKNLRFESTKVKLEPGQQQVYEVPKPFETFTITFVVDGPYANFVKFMSDLEGNLRLIDVVLVSVIANDRSDVYQYSVKLNTYWIQ